ncbi:unnamed protein product [Vitrella brassicaformis CCMP3155]|uniref:PPM-type phosphatase domain-containing protein n=3 Tax=Vitrella brassicaformis TaxID=1169539 RepID=A0A0G4H7U4_VITBC|nr:unnamed protein product [Vitrella brassicaformis CCMP3155]|eukprot:CEM39946.1 unnamed protein product [Vitrella brassicaformis CCMP3155]
MQRHQSFVPPPSPSASRPLQPPAARVPNAPTQPRPPLVKLSPNLRPSQPPFALPALHRNPSLPAGAFPYTRIPPPHTHSLSRDQSPFRGSFPRTGTHPLPMPGPPAGAAPAQVHTGPGLGQSAPPASFSPAPGRPPMHPPHMPFGAQPGGSSPSFPSPLPHPIRPHHFEGAHGHHGHPARLVTVGAAAFCGPYGAAGVNLRAQPSEEYHRMMEMKARLEALTKQAPPQRPPGSTLRVVTTQLSPNLPPYAAPVAAAQETAAKKEGVGGGGGGAQLLSPPLVPVVLSSESNEEQVSSDGGKEGEGRGEERDGDRDGRAGPGVGLGLGGGGRLEERAAPAAAAAAAAVAAVGERKAQAERERERDGEVAVGRAAVEKRDKIEKAVTEMQGKLDRLQKSLSRMETEKLSLAAEAEELRRSLELERLTSSSLRAQLALSQSIPQSPAAASPSLHGPGGGSNLHSSLRELSIGDDRPTGVHRRSTGGGRKKDKEHLRVSHASHTRGGFKGSRPVGVGVGVGRGGRGGSRGKKGRASDVPAGVAAEEDDTHDVGDASVALPPPSMPTQPTHTHEQTAPTTTTTTAAPTMPIAATDLPPLRFIIEGKFDIQPQADFAPKAVRAEPSGAVELLRRSLAWVCTRGRRLDDNVPNQDDFVLLQTTDGVMLFGAFDGHGQCGQECAAFVRQSLPECILGLPEFRVDPGMAFRKAFNMVQANLAQQAFDHKHSGATAVVAVITEAHAHAGGGGRLATAHGGAPDASRFLWTAHVGDSKAALVSASPAAAAAGGKATDSGSDLQANAGASYNVTVLTSDHKPDRQSEAERVSQCGGEVRPSNTGAMRLYGKGSPGPALAVTRAFGDTAATRCGVTHEPEIACYPLKDSSESMLVLGTDGLWVFCSPEHVAVQLLQGGVSAIHQVCAESRQQWADNSYNRTVDDVTAIAVAL